MIYKCLSDCSIGFSRHRKFVSQLSWYHFSHYLLKCCALFFFFFFFKLSIIFACLFPLIHLSYVQIGQYIASNGGVVAAEELAPYLDIDSTEGIKVIQYMFGSALLPFASTSTDVHILRDKWKLKIVAFSWTQKFNAHNIVLFV